MLDWFWWILHLLSMLCTGAAIAAAVRSRRPTSLTELAALMLTLGPGGLASLLLCISLCGLPPGRIVISIIGIASLTILIWLWRRKRLPRIAAPSPLSRADLVSMPIVLVVAAALAYVLVISLGYPLMEWDSIVIWAFKSRVLYYSALTPRPWYFTDVRYNYSHLDYPLLMPMMLTAAFAMMHQFNEYLARLLFAVLFSGQLLLIYTGARLFLPRMQAMMITVLTACCGMFIDQTVMATPEIILTAFIAGTTVYAIRWIDQRQTPDAIFAALFAVFAGLTKNEGLPLALITAGVMALFTLSAPPQRRRWKDLAVFCGIVGVGLGIWIVWRAGLPHTDENYPGQLRWSILSNNAGRVPLIVASGLKKMLAVSFWGGLWLLLPVMAGLGYRAWRNPRALALWCLLLAQLGVYVLVYTITPWDLAELIRVSMDRLLMHAVPLAGLIIAAHWGAMVQATHDQGQPHHEPQVSAAPSNAAPAPAGSS
jgi:hypothetical protein